MPSQNETRLIRTEEWLTERVCLLRDNHYSDVPQGYPITTRWGARARYRFGSISARNGVCLIMVNQLFADERVPCFVVDETIAHELAHYAHGYGSGLPRLYPHPHRGGIIEKELRQRGLGDLHDRAEQWRKTQWQTYYAANCEDLTNRREQRSEIHQVKWAGILDAPGNRTLDELTARLNYVVACLAVPAAPFQVHWLYATGRQSGLSYWYSKEKMVRVHGLLADRRVPSCVVDFELTYWTARLLYGDNWNILNPVIARAGLEPTMNDALRWRRAAWTAFRKRHLPV
jgi:hypothetical protein